MKQRTVFSIVAVVIIVLTLIIANSNNTPENARKELVIFYEVPLVCGAAPDIGCGSRAKPVFIEIEKHKNVKEAWLNRSGTVIAVVGGPSMTDWKELALIVEPIFTKHEVGAAYVKDKKRQDDLMSNFRVAGKWYKGADVDKLSIEEAGRIAERAVKYAKEARLINEPEAQAIKSDVETYFKKELVEVRTYDELETAGEQWYTDVYKIYQEHIGKERTDKVRQLYEEYQSSQPEKD